MAFRRIKSVEIPPEDQGVFAVILRLADSSLAGLEEALNRAIPTLERRKLISQLKSEPTLSTVEDLRDIVDAIVSIVGTAYSGGTTANEVIDAVIQAIKKDDIVELTDSDADLLRARLIRLCRLRVVELVAKASDLIGANDRTFQIARIVSDLRPICLGEEPTVSGGVIVHQLEITSLRNDRRETVFLTLDSLDLQSLHAAISRAMKKDKALRSYAGGLKTPILSPGTDNKENQDV